MPKKRDYLIQKPGSQNWHLLLQYPPGLAEVEGRKRRTISMKTPDRKLAELAAAPLIIEHRQKLYEHAAAKNLAKLPASKLLQMIQSRPAIAPGETVQNEDGTRSLATKDQILVLGADHSLIRTEPNEDKIFLSTALLNDQQKRGHAALRKAVDKSEEADREIIAAWVKDRNVKPRVATDGYRALQDFRTVTGKSLAKATYDDVRKLVEYYFSKGLKTSSVKKLIARLHTPCKLALREGKISLNPFTADMVPDKKDKKMRLPFTDDDMKLCRDMSNNLSHSDQLLWIWLATTGMRLGELFQIDEEFEEAGVRYVITGSKTSQSRRRIPIPDAVLPLVPGRITRILFTGGAPAASKRLNRFISKTVGITDERKVLHSLRHRAQDSLRAAKCPKDVREELLGHEEVTVGKSYGRGSPMPLLKSWIEQIGW